MRISHLQSMPIKEMGTELSQWVGKTLEGKVVALEGSILKLSLLEDNLILTLKLSDPVVAEEGDLVKANVVKLDNGKLLAELVETTSKPLELKSEKEAKPTHSVFEKLGITKNVANALIVEQLIKNEMPITKGAVVSVSQLDLLVKTLVSELKQMPEDGRRVLLERFDAPLKAFVIELLNNKSLPDKEATSNEQAKVVQESLLEQEGITKHMPRDLMPLLGKAEDAKAVVALVLNLLEQIDLPQETVFVKSDMPATVKALIHTQNNFAPVFTLSEAFESLSKVFSKMPLNEKQVNELLVLLSKPMPDKEKLEALSAFVRAASLPEKEKEAAERNIAFIKEAMDAPKAETPNHYTLHMPIELNHREERVTLYYKKSKKSQESNRFVIMVALKTNAFKEVRCLVEKNQTQFFLSFGFEDNSALEAFKTHQWVLLDRLRAYDVKASFKLWHQLQATFEKTDDLPTNGLQTHIDIRL